MQNVRTDLQKVVSDAGEEFAAQSVAAQITHDDIQKRLRVQEEAIALVVASATDELGKLRAEVNRTSGFSGGADPWLASRQATAPPATSDPSSSSTPPGILPAQMSEKQFFRVENKNWSEQNKRLTLVSQPEGYLVWRDRAMAHLTKDRPDVRDLLQWAEKQPEMLEADTEKEGATRTKLLEGPDKVALVSYALYDGIKHLLADTLLGRAKACGDGRGLELWRRLHAEWSGSAPQVLSAKSRKYQEPERCSSASTLWEALPPWIRLGEELVSNGLEVPDGEDKCLGEARTSGHGHRHRGKA